MCYECQIKDYVQLILKKLKKPPCTEFFVCNTVKCKQEAACKTANLWR